MCQPGRPRPHGRVPGGVLALLLRLPEREVERVLLAVGALDALALVHVVDVAVRELAVARVGAHAEVDVAVDRVGGPPSISAAISSTIGPIVSAASGSWSGRPRPRPSVSAM